MKLEWQDKRTDERGYYSTCKRYSVCSVGSGEDERWQAWKLAPGGAWFAPLETNLLSEQAARASAQADADRSAA
jgi:hypothetical protein